MLVALVLCRCKVSCMQSSYDGIAMCALLLLRGQMRSAALVGLPKTHGEPDLSAQSMLAPAELAHWCMATRQAVCACAADLNLRP